MADNRELDAAVITARKTNYLNSNYRYLKNVSIIEWDIKSAGLSVIKHKKLLPKEYIKKLEEMPKEKRTIKEGLLQKKYPKLAEAIVNTLSDAREKFIISNQILDFEILTIKKDAIFLINHIPEDTLIEDDFLFRRKNEYSSFILLNRKEFYYSSRDDSLTIKGIPQEYVAKQQEFLLKDIKKVLKIGETNSSEDLFRILQNYRLKYLRRELPVETYRELDSGMFRIGKYLAENIGEDMLQNVDITQNYVNYILPLIQSIL